MRVNPSPSGRSHAAPLGRPKPYSRPGRGGEQHPIRHGDGCLVGSAERAGPRLVPLAGRRSCQAWILIRVYAVPGRGRGVVGAQYGRHAAASTTPMGVPRCAEGFGERKATALMGEQSVERIARHLFMAGWDGGGGGACPSRSAVRRCEVWLPRFPKRTARVSQPRREYLLSSCPWISRRKDHVWALVNPRPSGARGCASSDWPNG